MKYAMLFLVLSVLLSVVIAGCMIQPGYDMDNQDEGVEEFPVGEVPELCGAYEVDPEAGWTVGFFDRDIDNNIDDICVNLEAYPYVVSRYDTDLINDLCVKKDALESNDADVCMQTETCFVRDYCLVELEIQNDPDYCADASGIESDYCEIIYLRDNHGYRPTSSADCSEVKNSELFDYCEEAYRRKE